MTFYFFTTHSYILVCLLLLKFFLCVINHFEVKKTCCEMRVSVTWRHFLSLNFFKTKVENFHL